MHFLSKRLWVVVMVCGFVAGALAPITQSEAATNKGSDEIKDPATLCQQLLYAHNHAFGGSVAGADGFNLLITLLFYNEPSDDILLVAKRQVQEGQNINHETRYGDTALSMALSRKHFSVADYLLDQPGIDVNIINARDNMSPLLVALSAQVDAPLDLVRKLIRKGAHTAHKTASATALTGAIQNGDIERLNVLLTELGVSVRDEDMIQASQIRDLTQSPNREVQLAAEEARKQVLQILLQNGGNPNALSGQGFTPLIYVLFYDNRMVTSQDTVDLLIRAGADVNHQTEYGDTALSMAISNEDFATVDYLLKIENINVRTVNKRNGHTVLQEAAFACANSGTLMRIAQLEVAQSPQPAVTLPQVAQVETKKEKFVCPDEGHEGHYWGRCKHCIERMNELSPL